MDRQKSRWFVVLLCLGLLLALAAPLSAAPQADEVLTLPPVDVDALRAEDLVRAEAGLPPRFAYPLKVDATPATHGAWQTLDDGQLLWRLRIVSPGALTLNLGFSRYHMPAGGALTLYSADRKLAHGPFTEADNETHGQLWTPVVLGDEVIVEVLIPSEQVAALDLALTQVGHGYAGFGAPLGIESGACNLDVVCSAADGFPQVDPWREPIRSVGVISTGGSTFCTGFLVNNTAQDLTPFFMTANHCGINSGNAASLVVYWNYENSWCRPPDSGASGGPGDGTLNQFNTGSYFRASSSASDFTLVELDDDPDPAFDVHWAGWDRRDQATASAVAIHHPNTDEKRISFEDQPTAIAAYLGNPGSGDTHIRVEDWDLGTTEPGSSGSPLFSPEKRVIGQLHGGYAACGNDDPDWYGRFYTSWAGGGTPSSRLSDWLDPTGSGAPYIDGRDLIETSFNMDVAPAEVDVCAPAEATYGISVTRAVVGFGDPVTLSVTGVPSGAVGIFSTNPVIPTGTSVLTIANTAAAPAGLYDLDIAGSAGTATETLTVTVRLNLYAGVSATPVLSTPTDGAVDQSPIPELAWFAEDSASNYNLQLDTSPLFGAPLIDEMGLEATTYTPASPLDGGRCYWWRVQGENACGVGDWADPFHFATANLATSFLRRHRVGRRQLEPPGRRGRGCLGHLDQRRPQPHPFLVRARRRHHHRHPAVEYERAAHWRRQQSQLLAHVSTLRAAGTASVLEISTDGGSHWTDLEPYITQGGYNGTISDLLRQPAGRPRRLDRRPRAAGQQVIVDLCTFAGQSAQFRWRLGCDSSVSSVGWYIDDVQLTAPLPPNPAPSLLSITPDNGSAYDRHPGNNRGQRIPHYPGGQPGRHLAAVGDAGQLHHADGRRAGGDGRRRLHPDAVQRRLPGSNAGRRLHRRRGVHLAHRNVRGWQPGHSRPAVGLHGHGDGHRSLYLHLGLWRAWRGRRRRRRHTRLHLHGLRRL